MQSADSGQITQAGLRGVQMVALNWQTFDVAAEINAAYFTRNGRSGYALKPPILRAKRSETSKKDKEVLGTIEKYVLVVEVLSAQQLPRPKLDGDSKNPELQFAVDYHEGAAVGYKWFDLKGHKPLFPFGCVRTYFTELKHSKI